MKIKTERYVALLHQETHDRNYELYMKFFGTNLIKAHVDGGAERWEGVGRWTEGMDAIEYRKLIATTMVGALDQNKNYMVTSTAMQNLILKIKNPLKAIQLLDDRVKKKMVTFSFSDDPNEFFRFYTIADMMYIMYCHQLPNDKGDPEQVDFSFFAINIATKQYDAEDDPHHTFENFLRILIFIFYSNQDFIFLEPGGRHGKTRKQGKILNETKLNVTVVDSTWNKNIVRIGDFPVTGHFRLQACGVGSADRKLIWIDAFVKHQYIRKSKSN